MSPRVPGGLPAGLPDWPGRHGLRPEMFAVMLECYPTGREDARGRFTPSEGRAKVIIPLTVKEILDEELARKLA